MVKLCTLNFVHKLTASLMKYNGEIINGTNKGNKTADLNVQNYCVIHIVMSTCRGHVGWVRCCLSVCLIINFHDGCMIFAVFDVSLFVCRP